MRHTILLVDDDPNITQALKRALRQEPYDVLTAQSAAEALQILARQAADVVVSDEQMPGMHGTEFLAQVCLKYPDTVRIMLTGQAVLHVAVDAINQGHVHRFLLKPCHGADLAVTLRQALEHQTLLAESRRLLRVAKGQTERLRELEDAHPGITRVDTDPHGILVLDEEKDLDFTSLMQQMNSAVEEGTRLLSRPRPADADGASGEA